MYQGILNENPAVPAGSHQASTHALNPATSRHSIKVVEELGRLLGSQSVVVTYLTTLSLYEKQGERGLQSLSRGKLAMHSKFAEPCSHIKRCAYRDHPVATIIESLLRGPMRISAPGDCNHAFRQSSGVFAVQKIAVVA